MIKKGKIIQREVKMSMKSLKYPVVFVHGMFGWGEDVAFDRVIPYWGITCGSITKYLRSKNIECYSVSVGPASSAWDQACELYAQLTGTTVDYGKVHSEKHNHKQFGRQFTKRVFDGWSEDKKVHLVGHSFGGTCIRMLCHLLQYGAPEEVEASGDKVSDLFKGGKGNLVASINALCSPMGDIDTYKAFQEKNFIPIIQKGMSSYTGTFGRTILNGKVVDFKLEQFGLTNTPGKRDADNKKEAKKRFIQSNDNIIYDLSPEGIKKINDRIEIVPDVYYFSYPFNAMEYSEKKQRDAITHTHFIGLRYSAYLLMKYSHKNGVYVGNGQDGLVNVSAATNPPDEPFAPFNENFKKGVWNVMPVEKGDHGTPVGLFVNRKYIHNFYDNFAVLLKKVEQKEG